jgi:hypothetical protein
MASASVSSNTGGALISPILPGTSRGEIEAADAALRARPDPPAFESFTGTFATQEYIQATISQSNYSITQRKNNQLGRGAPKMSPMTKSCT